MSINLFLIFMVVLLICKIADGYKKGMIREIISIVSLVFLCIVAVLIANGVKSYLNGKTINVVVALVLLIVISIAHHFLNLLFFPAKLISKLPIIHGVDKLLGIIVGALETVLLLWTIYTLVMLMDLGMAGSFVRACAAENPVLSWFYEHNQLAGWIEKLSDGLSGKLYFVH